MSDERELLDFADYPEIDCHGIGDIRVYRKSLTICLFRWKRIDGVYRRCMNVAVNRPLEEQEIEPMRAFASLYQPRPEVTH